jgi:hypothetical protein
MKKSLFILLLLSYLNCYSQRDGLKYRNKISYKIELIEKEFNDLIEIKRYPDCNSISKCLFYFYGRMEEDTELILKSRLRELAKRYIDNNQTLILTYGTNGDGGLGVEKLDKKTKKYRCVFVSVNNSCQINKLSEAIQIFNEVSFKHLDSKYGAIWREDINTVLRRKWGKGLLQLLK